MFKRATSSATKRQREILEAASRVFRRRGLHNSGMREIAREAGMTAGNLYYYFESKQALLAFCQEHALEGLLALARRELSSAERVDRRLHRLIEGHLVHLNETVPGSLAHLEVEGLEEPFRSEILEQRTRYEVAVRTLVQQGVQEGVFRRVEPRTAALAILGALNWSVKWFRSDGGRSAREIGQDFAELLVRGLLASPAIVGCEPSPEEEICPSP